MTIVERIWNKDIRQDAITMLFVILDNNGKIAELQMQFRKWVFYRQLTRRHCASDSESQNKNRESYIGRGHGKVD